MTRNMTALGLMTLLVGGCASIPAPPAAITPPAGTAPPATMQYLYGSGEAAGLSRQAYRGLVDYVARAVERHRAGAPYTSVLLSPQSTLSALKFEDCGTKPPAIVLDTDETAVLNIGFEADQAERGGVYNAARWNRWEQTGGNAVAAVPGALDAVRAIRATGVDVVFNSNRLAANAGATEKMLAALGFGAVKHGATLFLTGDDATGSHKDGRRTVIGARYCVIAMGGDQLGDFSDLFNGVAEPMARRAAADAGPLGALWGNGWFLLPNPVYGPALRGDMEAVFPGPLRWRDPAEKPAQ